jgi:regulator of replication initiation timing
MSSEPCPVCKLLIEVNSNLVDTLATQEQEIQDYKRALEQSENANATLRETVKGLRQRLYDADARP